MPYVSRSVILRLSTPVAAPAQVLTIEQEIAPVLLGLYRVVGRARTDDPEIAHGHLDPPRRSGIAPDLARELDGGLQGELAKTLPQLWRHLALDQDSLHDTGAITHHHERYFAGGANVCHPGAHGGSMAGKLAEPGDAYYAQCH